VLPSVYAGAFIDTHLHETFLNLQALGEGRICYLADVEFTHRHFRVTKEVPNETYKRRDRFGDDLTFLRYAKIRHSVSLGMKVYIQTGDLRSGSGIANVLDGIMTRFYIRGCPR